MQKSFLPQRRQKCQAAFLWISGDSGRVLATKNTLYIQINNKIHVLRTVLLITVSYHILHVIVERKITKKFSLECQINSKQKQRTNWVTPCLSYLGSRASYNLTAYAFLKYYFPVTEEILRCTNVYFYVIISISSNKNGEAGSSDQPGSCRSWSKFMKYTEI